MGARRFGLYGNTQSPLFYLSCVTVSLSDTHMFLLYSLSMFRVWFAFPCGDLADSLPFLFFSASSTPFFFFQWSGCELTSSCFGFDEILCLCGVPGVVNEFTTCAHCVCLKSHSAGSFLLRLLMPLKGEILGMSVMTTLFSSWSTDRPACNRMVAFSFPELIKSISAPYRSSSTHWLVLMFE